MTTLSSTRALRSSRPRHGLASVAAAAGLLVTTIFSVSPAYADFQNAGSGSDVVIGKDNDNQNNVVIQPAGTAANQSLNNTDIMLGGSGNDVIIGLLGSDVMLGGSGSDIMVGGTEQGQAPNSDVMFGDSGNDVSLWAAGDGSEAFIGGTGTDAQVFGAIDRANNVPTLGGTAPGFPSGVPTANLSTQGGFCTLEKVTDPALGYEYLVRFFVRTTGNLAVTVRLNETEQVFCTNQAGGSITYADLTSDWPEFADVTLDQVKQLNPLVGQIAR